MAVDALVMDLPTKLNICGLSKGDIHEKPTTIIHHGGGIAAGAGAVSAQGMKNDETPARAPAAQQNAPAEKVAPAMKPGEQKAGTKKAPTRSARRRKHPISGKSQTIDKSAPAGAAADVKAGTKGDVKSEAAPKGK